jgi:hypothetical protein
MHRGDPWALDLLKRYYKEGIEGQKDKTKACGIPPEVWIDEKKRPVVRITNSHKHYVCLIL